MVARAPTRGPRRTTALLAAAAGSALVLLLLGLQARSGEPPAWDARLHDATVGLSPRVDARSELVDDAVGYGVVYAADAIALTALIAVAAVVAVTRSLRHAAFLVLAVAVAVALVYVLKGAFDRPPGAGYGKYELPSGHAMRSFLAAGLVIAAAWGTRARAAAVAAAGAYAAAVSGAVVYEDWHLPSDVVAGWALAGLALLAVLLLDAAAARRPAEAAADTATSREG